MLTAIVNIQFSRHGRWAHPYPVISLTFWQCRDVLPLEQKCSKHWTPANLDATSAYLFNLCKFFTYLRMECNYFTCSIELVLPPLAFPLCSCILQAINWTVGRPGNKANPNGLCLCPSVASMNISNGQWISQTINEYFTLCAVTQNPQVLGTSLSI